MTTLKFCVECGFLARDEDTECKNCATDFSDETCKNQVEGEFSEENAVKMRRICGYE